MNTEAFAKVKEICEEFKVDTARLLVMKGHMLEEIEKGLSKKTHDSSTIKCWPTYVQNFPNGCEHGTFLVADLAPSFIRISLFHLKGENGYSVEKETYEVTHNYKNMFVFDFMAQCLQRFVKSYQIARDPLELAVTFCFPLEHKSLSNASITKFKFTSIFAFKDADNVNLGEVISNALHKLKLHIQLVAVLDGATGVLLACHRSSSTCKIGIVIGRATNAAYVENVENIQLCENCQQQPSMIINTDWGAFGDTTSLRTVYTKYDREIDDKCSDPTQRLFEKMTSDEYVAEFARRIFVACAKEGCLFGGNIGNQLKNPYTFKTRHFLEMLDDDVHDFDNTRLAFDRLGVSRPSVDECRKVRFILESLVWRTSALVAAGIAAIMQKIGDKEIVVGVDGSFCRDNKYFQEYLRECLQATVADQGITFELEFVKGGCERGAAILAAITMQKEFIYQE